MVNEHTKQIATWRQRFDVCLTKLLAKPSTCPDNLKQAIDYSLLNGGKRLRPLLVYATGTALGAELESLDNAALAVEYIHTYSLIHDDLPAMDDDDLRRGKPSTHKAFGEAMAILAGDALQSQAFDLISQPQSSLSSTQKAEMIHCLAQGALGMVHGQALDLGAENKAISAEELKSIHHLKTGKLICSSIILGAIAAPNYNSEIHNQLQQFAGNIGLAFQVRDDILDVIGNSKELGKPQGSDQALNKSTYPKLIGLDQAQNFCDQLLTNALEILKQLPNNMTVLAKIAEQMVNRSH